MADAASSIDIGGLLQGFDLNTQAPPALQQKFSNLQSQLSSSISDVGTQFKNAQAATDTTKAAISEQADVTNQINNVLAASKAKEQADNLKAITDFGLNPEASNYVISSLAQKISAEDQGISQRQDMIQKKLDQSFWDDPLQFIINQIALPFDQAGLQFAQETKDANFKELAQLTNAVNEAAQTNAIRDQADATTIAALQSKKVLADATIKSAAADQDLAALGLKAISVRTAMNEQQFQAAISLNNAGVQQANLQINEAQLGFAGEHLKLAEQSADLAQKQYASQLAHMSVEEGQAAERLKLAKDDSERNKIYQQEELKLRKATDQRAQQELELHTAYQKALLGKIEESNAAKAMMNSRLKYVAQLAGSPNKALTADELIGFAPKQRAVIENWALGEDLTAGRLGSTPVEAVNNLIVAGYTGNPAMQFVIGKVQSIEAGIAAKPAINGAPFMSLNADSKQLAYTIGVLDTINKERTAIPTTGGIFSPGTMWDTLTIPKVASLDIAKTLMPIAAANKQSPTDPDLVLTSAASLIAQGKLTPAQAAEQVSTMYQSIIASNNEVRGYAKFAIKPLDKFPTVTNSMTFPGIHFSNKQVIDMTNKAQLQAVFTRNFIKTQVPNILDETLPSALAPSNFRTPAGK